MTKRRKKMLTQFAISYLTDTLKVLPRFESSALCLFVGGTQVLQTAKFRPKRAAYPLVSLRPLCCDEDADLASAEGYAVSSPAVHHPRTVLSSSPRSVLSGKRTFLSAPKRSARTSVHSWIAGTLARATRVMSPKPLANQKI